MILNLLVQSPKVPALTVRTAYGCTYTYFSLLHWLLWIIARRIHQRLEVFQHLPSPPVDHLLVGLREVSDGLHRLVLQCYSLQVAIMGLQNYTGTWGEKNCVTIVSPENYRDGLRILCKDV